jgi:hypothetical protein
VVERRDAWIAFVLSVALPGTGQLWIGSLWGVAWLLSGALLLVFWSLVTENVGRVPPLWQYLTFLSLGLISGWHAARLGRMSKA